MFEQRRSARRAQGMERAKRLRSRTSMPERVLWQRLRGRRFLGLKFRRQHPIGAYVADFYCDELRLVVEVDGESHRERADRDAARDEYMRSEELHVMRMSASDVSRDVDLCLARLKAWIEGLRDPEEGG